MDSDLTDELLDFFKALSDVDRLKVAGLVAQGASSVEAVATTLHMPSAVAARHLARLAEAGLVTVDDQPGAKTYRFAVEALQARARHVHTLARARPERSADDGRPAAERKILASFFAPEGHLRSIPVQYTKLQVVLRHLATMFTAGTRYTEREVNEILARFHEDTATLRRNLVDAKLLSRSPSGSEYVRVTGET